MYTEIDNLLMGYKDEKGVFHKEFEYREMTGNDEEAISKATVRENGAKVVRVILDRCIVRIGNIEKSAVKPSEWTDMIQSLTIADQDYAVMKIRALTLGDELEVKQYKCPNCKDKIDAIFSLNDFRLIPFNGEEEIEFELPKGYRDKDGNLHTRGTLRYPIGLDRELLDSVTKRNMATANTLLLSRCMLSLGDLKLHDGIIRELSMKDRNYLFEVFKENLFGYDISDITIQCSSCGEELNVTLNSASFL